MNLRPIDRERVLACFHQAFQGEAHLWAYGSRVKKTNHEGSDLDLVVVAIKPGQTLRPQLVRFRQLLHDSNIPILVQVQDWHTLPPTFQQEILKEKEVMA